MNNYPELRVTLEEAAQKLADTLGQDVPRNISLQGAFSIAQRIHKAARAVNETINELENWGPRR